MNPFRSMFAAMLLSASVLAGCGFPACAAQQTSTASATSSKGLVRMSKEQREEMQRADRRILLNVLVDDASGKPVGGLSEQNFQLVDQHEGRRISSFEVVDGSSASGRAHIEFVIDTVNNSFQDVARQRHAVEAYLLQRGGALPYPVSLVLLADAGVRRIETSRDGLLLIREMREKFPRPGRFSFHGGPSGGNQRFLSSLKELRVLLEEERDVTGRAILIWMGHGWPSLVDPGYEAATADDKRSYFDTLVQISTLAREDQVVIENVVEPESNEIDSRIDRSLLDGVRGFRDIEARNLSLPLLALQSGGRFLSRSPDMVAEIAKCVSDAEVYYRLSFDPQAAPVPNELRSLEVRLSRPDLTARTNLLYYAQP